MPDHCTARPPRDAFTTQVQRLTPVVRGICASRLGPTDIDDAIQEVLLRAYKSLDRVERPQQLCGYLCKIAHNLCTDRIRRRLRRHERETVSLEDLDSEPVDSGEPFDLDVVFMRHQLARELGRLPPRQREVVHKFHFEGMSYAEAASAMGVTVPAVNQLLSRARNQLRSAFAVRQPA